MVGERARFLLRCLLAVNLGLAAIYLGNALLGKPNAVFTRSIDLNGEFNIPALLSGFQLAVAGLMVALASLRAPQGRLAALAISGILVGLGLDEVFQFHEWLGYRADALFHIANRSESLLPRTGVWMIVLGPPALLTTYIVLKASARHWKEHPDSARLVAGGFSLLFFGAIVLEMLSNLTLKGSLLSAIQVTCEESCEMCGGALILTGCAVWLSQVTMRSMPTYQTEPPADRPLLELGSS